VVCRAAVTIVRWACVACPAACESQAANSLNPLSVYIGKSTARALLDMVPPWSVTSIHPVSRSTYVTMDARRLYINLLKQAVRNELYRVRVAAAPASAEELERARAHLDYLRATFGPAADSIGLTPEDVCGAWKGLRPMGHTLCDQRQLDNVQQCVEYVIENDIPGDLIEAGVYRGGQCIFMRGILKVHGVTDRKVFVADSFKGLPVPDKDKNVDDAIAFEFLKHFDVYAVDIAEVRDNFARYELLDENVVFLEGWFKDTLPAAPIMRIAVMRLDGDFYESTRDSLEGLYARLSAGGFVIIDDYGLPVGCRRAVDEFRREHDIHAAIQWVNDHTVFWQKA
jgi:O-methyltransferase